MLLLRVTIGGAILQFYLDKVCLDGAPGVSLKEFLQDISLLTIKLLKGIKKKYYSLHIFQRPSLSFLLHNYIITINSDFDIHIPRNPSSVLSPTAACG